MKELYTLMLKSSKKEIFPLGRNISAYDDVCMYVHTQYRLRVNEIFHKMYCAVYFLSWVFLEKEYVEVLLSILVLDLWILGIQKLEFLLI